MTHSWTRDKRAFENYIISKAKHVVSTQKNRLIEHPNIVKTDWLENNHNYILKYCFPIWTYERALDTDQGNIQVIFPSPPPSPPPPQKKKPHTQKKQQQHNIQWVVSIEHQAFFSRRRKRKLLGREKDRMLERIDAQCLGLHVHCMNILAHLSHRLMVSYCDPMIRALNQSGLALFCRYLKIRALN